MQKTKQKNPSNKIIKQYRRGNICNKSELGLTINLVEALFI